MKLDFSGNRITLDKELNALDRFVLKFTSVLNECDIR